jgi:hypothetical protein
MKSRAKKVSSSLGVGGRAYSYAGLSAGAVCDEEDFGGELELEQATVEQGNTSASYNLPALYTLARYVA